MDLNKLFAQHQLALIRAADADRCKDRDRHRTEADNIASVIAAIRKRDGAYGAPLLPAGAV